MSTTYVIELGYSGDFSSIILDKKKQKKEILKEIVNQTRADKCLEKLGSNIMSQLNYLFTLEYLFGDKSDKEVEKMIRDKLEYYRPSNNEDMTIQIEETEDNYKVILTCSGGGYDRTIKEICARAFVKEVYDFAYVTGLEICIYVI